MEEGTDKLAQMAARALLTINDNSHILIPNLLSVLFVGMPSWSQPWRR
jgi:hypothetical protein